MTICLMLLKVLLSLVLTAINVIEFFLLVEIVMQWKEVSWLKSFAVAGKDLVANFTTFTDKLVQRFTHRSLSDKGKIVIGLVILELLTLLINMIY